MKNSKLVTLMMALAIIFLSISPALPGGVSGALAQTGPQSVTGIAVNSPYASTPPVLDGSLGFNEWNATGEFAFHDGTITVNNDNTRLFILLDVTNATTDDPNDYFYVTFDKNQNGKIDANLDMNYGSLPRTDNIRYQFYTAPNHWTTVNPTTYSARAKGFGCFWADGTFLVTGFFPLHIVCSQHRVWELGIDLSEIGAFAGGTVKMGIRAVGIKPAYSDDIPTGFTGDFSNLITVNLAPPPFFSIAPLKGAVPAFETNPIELTQAVQTRNNHEPLVANKSTVARVYTITGNVSIGETVNTYLYGSNGAIDLPGSPMLVQQRAPTVINRLNLNDTANFFLPSTWLSGSVTFQAKALDHNLNSASTATQTVAYTSTRALNIWIIPINTGTAGSPVLPSQAEIERQKSYLRTIYPVATVNFTQKSWTVLGVVTDEPIPHINTYYNNLALGYILTCLFGTCPNYPLPDQIYGFIPSGGGLSDPVWVGGEGIAARGFQGTSMEGTMAHEINHNLDKDPSGTWGHHTPFGCGAAGPDPAWPYSNPNINEVGFDTRLPWSTSSSQKTVIPSTVPDLMSYCQSGFLPTKWISPYRWENLLNHATIASLASLNNANLPTPTAVEFYYISGKLTLTGKTVSGHMDPIFQLPSPFSPSVTDMNGNFAIRLIGGPGVLNEFRFKGTFINDPEEPVNNIFFNFRLPLIPAAVVTSVELVNLSNNQVLDTINAGGAALTLNVTAPAAGATWSGTQNLTWTTSNNFALDTFNVLFSKDGGVNWDPVATGLKGVNSLAIDTKTLPNTPTAIFQVVASDGYNTGQANSSQFTVNNPNPQPTVEITSPLNNFSTTPTNSVLLEGSGSDPTDGPLADDHLYWYEGANPLGNGSHLVANFPFGLHTLTLKGVNTGGQTATASITILVGLDKQIYLSNIAH